jgi:hypothetical protein
MTIRLNPRSEDLLNQQLARGHYHSPEEVIEHALEILTEREQVVQPDRPRRNSTLLSRLWSKGPKRCLLFPQRRPLAPASTATTTDDRRCASDGHEYPSTRKTWRSSGMLHAPAPQNGYGLSPSRRVGGAAAQPKTEARGTARCGFEVRSTPSLASCIPSGV